MAAGGIALRSISWVVRAIQFGCAAIILGICSYYLATLSNHGLHIATYLRAVEGISGAAVVYLAFALILLCCLAGKAFFALLAIILDIAFCGAFIYVAWALRGGAGSCRGNVNTPFGSGDTSTSNGSVSNGKGGFTTLPSLYTACRLETAAFAVAIIAAFLFLISAVLEVFLAKHHKKEKAFGPSPTNGYTAGSSKRKFWQRGPKHQRAAAVPLNDNALPPHSQPADIRTSYATDATAVNRDSHGAYAEPKYGAHEIGTAHTNNAHAYQHNGVAERGQVPHTTQAANF